jgi:hypothetical protein
LAYIAIISQLHPTQVAGAGPWNSTLPILTEKVIWRWTGAKDNNCKAGNVLS